MWPKQVLGLQLFLEARALLSFRQALLFVRDPLFRDVTDALWAATLAANRGPGQWYADSDSLRYSFFDKVESED